MVVFLKREKRSTFCSCSLLSSLSVANILPYFCSCDPAFWRCNGDAAYNYTDHNIELQDNNNSEKMTPMFINLHVQADTF